MLISSKIYPLKPTPDDRNLVQNLIITHLQGFSLRFHEHDLADNLSRSPCNCIYEQTHPVPYYDIDYDYSKKKKGDPIEKAYGRKSFDP